MNLGPLLVLLAGYVFLKERIANIEIFNILFSFCVVTFLIAIKNKQSTVRESSEIGFVFSIVGCFMALVFETIAIVCIRKAKEVHFSNVNTMFGYFLVVVSILVWIIYYNK